MDLVDDLDPSYTVLGSPTVTGGSGFVTNTFSGQTVDIGQGAISPGQTVTISFKVTVSATVAAGLVIHNANPPLGGTIDVTGTSLPAVGATDERTETATPNDKTFTVASPNAPVETETTTSLITDIPTITQLARGETMTVEIDMNFPEGTTSGAAYTLTPLPAGLTYVAGSATIVTPTVAPFSSNGAFNGTASAPTVTVNAGSLVFTFGTVVHNVHKSANNSLSFTIQLLAATGSAATTWSFGGNLAATTPAAFSVAATPAAVSGTFVTPTLAVTSGLSASTGDAGDQITITLTVTNTGAGPAYLVGLSDVVDSHYSFVSLTQGSFTSSSSAGFPTVTFSGASSSPATSRRRRSRRRSSSRSPTRRSPAACSRTRSRSRP